MSRRKNNDIKAPDGYLIGGLRKVRSDGTLLFQRDYWVCPTEWIGEEVWVHALGSGDDNLEAWPPGIEVYAHKKSVLLEGANRMSAKTSYRSKVNKDWALRCQVIAARKAQ